MRLHALLSCSFLALIVAVGATVAIGAEPPLRTIKVSAMREMEVVPDEVVLSLSISAEDEKSPITAKSENDKRTRAILDAVKSHGIEDKFVKIDCLEIRPQYDSHSRELLYYSVTRGMDITLQNFDLLEPILSDALQAGSNRVTGILFRTTKHREHQFEARRLAVEYAKEKAGHLAELNGLRLGTAITIEEDVEGSIHTEGSGFGGGMGGMGSPSASNKHTSNIVLVAMNKDGKKAEAAAKTTPNAGKVIAPGTITISATVTITFELKELAH
jgi:uncharacterized protein